MAKWGVEPGRALEGLWSRGGCSERRPSRDQGGASDGHPVGWQWDRSNAFVGVDKLWNHFGALHDYEACVPKMAGRVDIGGYLASGVWAVLGGCVQSDSFAWDGSREAAA